MNKTFNVDLTLDHPGFNDPKYRSQRDAIALEARKFMQEFQKTSNFSLIPEINYTQEQHKLWQLLFSKLQSEIKQHACQQIINSFQKLQLDPNHIPKFKDINHTLQKHNSPIKIIPIDGHAKVSVFFGHLAKAQHLSTQYIRHTNQPEFTPEPDIIHDILGHLPAYLITKMTQTAILIGKASQGANQELLDKLDRIFWFSFEYGLCQENGQIKAFGSGNLSSLSDLKRCTDPKQVIHKKFNITDIINTPYDPTQANKILFVADSIDDAMDQIQNFLKTLAT